MAFYLAIWGLFTFGMFIGTLRLNHALQVVFGTLAMLFWLLALGDLTGNAAITQVAGVVGIVCGLSAVYTAIALVLNEVYGHTVFPLGPIAHRPEPIADASAPVARQPQAQASPSGH
jgi:succinate-acetate transporter protein